MSVKIIDTLKPKNNGSFPIVEAVDVAVSADLRLPEALAAKADASALSATDAAVATKADASAVATATANLQGQIDQIEISSTAEAIVAPEVSAARVGYDGKSYQTLKSRLDSEAEETAEEISKILDVSEAEYTSTSGYYITPSGSKSQSQGFAYTAPIELKKNEEIRFKAAGYLTYVSMISTCNSDGTGIVSKVRSTGNDVSEYSYVATEDQYIILSYDETKSNSASIVGENSPGAVSRKCNALSNEVDVLQSAIMSPSTVFDFSDTETYTAGKYVQSNGSVGSSDGFAKSIPIHADKGTKITFYAKGYLTHVAMIAKYENGIYTPLVISTGSSAATYEYTTTEECDIVLSTMVDINPSATFQPIDRISVVDNRCDELVEEVANVQNAIQSQTITYDFSDPETYTSGKYVQANGSVGTSEGFAKSNPIHIEKGTSIRFFAEGYLTHVAIISKFENGVYVPLVISTGSSATTYEYTTTEACDIVFSTSLDINPIAYMQPPDRITIISDVCKKNEDDIAELKNDYETIDYTFLFRRMIGIGDSLMSGEIYDTANDYMRDCYHYSWLAMLSKYNDAEYHCFSNGGLTTRGWLRSHWKTDLESITDVPDVVFIALGTNDKNYQESIPTGTPEDDSSDETFCGYYKQIIELVHSVNPYAKVICCSMYTTSNDDAEYSSLVEAISQQYSYCYYIDIPANTTIRPYPNSVYAENWHFSTLGYRVIADVVHKLLNDSITDNLADYKYFGLYND